MRVAGRSSADHLAHEKKRIADIRKRVCETLRRVHGAQRVCVARPCIHELSIVHVVRARGHRTRLGMLLAMRNKTRLEPVSDQESVSLIASV